MTVAPTTQGETLERALARVRAGFVAVERPGGPEFVEVDWPAGLAATLDGDRVLGLVPPCPLENLGDSAFLREHGLRFAMVSGAMANGIGSTEIVEAMGRGGMLGIFGAAGLPVPAVEAAIDRLEHNLDASVPRGFNLIHSPGEPTLEAAVVDLYLRRNIRLVEASAYLDLTLPVVRYRVAGLRRDASGRVVAPNKVIAKVSRVEVATKFLAPPPPKLLAELVNRGDITAEQAAMAAEIPMAADITAEADSGGHTDNQPAIVLLPTMLALRDRIQAQHGYAQVPRIGAAGGISTPWSAAGALAMGAAYLVIGSVSQSCVESGTSDAVRTMLAEARQADIAMAPAADMFEMGIKLQVLKRGTLFAMRAAKLYEAYRAYDSIEAIPAAERATLEKTIFRLPLDAVWVQTKAFFAVRDPSQVERADRDPRHKMALVFRWYLGQSSHWANAGDASRAVDYQVWCGPAMAAFNDWVRGTWLEAPAARRILPASLNILHGAAVLQRARSLAAQGLAPPTGTPRLVPLEPADLDPLILP
ncbi:PfaD family polyunsaturated fatty acid/polyketide biosynthesis protein [Isosphaeraceae bacterium EP7]